MKPVSCGIAIRSWLSSIRRSRVVPDPIAPTMKIGPRTGAGRRRLASTESLAGAGRGGGRVYKGPFIARRAVRAPKLACASGGRVKLEDVEETLVAAVCERVR